MTFEELIGSKLVFGIPGARVTPEDVRHFKETNCSGLILYRINFESPDQIRALITDFENALGRRLLVCTDHEGGRVIMFGGGVTIFPSSQAVGKTGQTAFARRQGETEGRELRRLGIDVNFAPVLDVLTETYSPNIGIRAYGSDPELVAKMGAARISAMQVEGVSACAKHFPGLGPATLDPHLRLPVIQASWQDIENVHAVPFTRAMRTAVHSIMTSHPLYPQLDPSPKTPATFSRRIVHDYLRQKTGYKGVIFTDDLEMGAIMELCPIGEAAVRSVEAGHDMVLSCHDRAAQRRVYDALVEAARSKRLRTKELEDSAQRIAMLSGRRTERFGADAATPARADKERSDAQALVREITTASVTVLSDGPGLAVGASTAVIFPRLSALAPRIMIQSELLDEKAFLQNLFKPLSAELRVSLYDVDRASEGILLAVDHAAAASQTVLFLEDAHIHPSQLQLLKSLQGAAKGLVVVLLRDVYDSAYVQPGALCITNFGARVCDLTAVVDRLLRLSSVAAEQ
ncbi:MAG TPA: beta-N-acetylhexosaminidase [Elusimicrobiota bacterium]|nr:beta-N-acetylhexosaminidase [Elusimicrobiota bacterium]